MKNKNIYSSFFIPCLILLAVISRLPQLFSPLLILDGDECILGLMAKHITEGKELPVYFYGQSYGFSLIENLMAAASFCLFGVGDMQLKIAMLILWTAGIIFFYKSMTLLSNDKFAFMFSILFILIPSWAVWAMKARGGYITAFTCSFIIIYWLIKIKDKPGYIVCLMIGIIFGLLFLSQPFWIPGILSVLFYVFIYKKRWKQLMFFSIGVLSFPILIKFIILNNSSTYWQPDVFGQLNILNSIKYLPDELFHHFNGVENLDPKICNSMITVVSGITWLLLFIVVFILQLYRILKKKYLIWSHLFFVSVLLTLSYTFLLREHFANRYLLPLSGYFILCLGIEINDLASRYIPFKKILIYAFLTITLIGFISIYDFKNSNYLPPLLNENKSEKELINEITGFLEKNNIRYTFSLDPNLQWMAMFYSKEHVISRWTDDEDRCPEYPAMVDKAIDNGSNTAIIGYSFNYYLVERFIVKDSSIIFSNKRYFVYLNPKKDMLDKLEFEF